MTTLLCSCFYTDLGKQCAVLDIPPPVPKKFLIDRTGEEIITDEEGEKFLRYYINLRKTIKTTWY